MELLKDRKCRIHVRLHTACNGLTFGRLLSHGAVKLCNHLPAAHVLLEFQPSTFLQKRPVEMCQGEGLKMDMKHQPFVRSPQSIVGKALYLINLSVCFLYDLGFMLQYGWYRGV